jgi:OmpA-OmpF porin, OOP family
MTIRMVKAVACALAAAAAFHVTPASAQQVVEARGYAANRFEPSERGSHWFANESLDLRGHFRPAIGIIGEYSYRSLLIFAPDDDVQNSVVRNAFYLHPGASMVFFDRLRISASMPIQAAVDGHSGSVTRDGVTTFFAAPPRYGGLGDLRFGADVRLYGVHGDAITIAGGLQAWAPTGLRSQWAGDNNWRLKPRVMVAGDIGMFTYAGSLGVMWRERNEIIGHGAIGSELNLTAAGGVRVLDKNLVVGPEIWMSTVFDEFFGKKETPVEAALGAHYLALDQVRFGAFGALGLDRSFGAPVGRYGVMVEWAPGVVDDRDGDGIKDSEDACPDVKGVRSAEPSKNGCPPDKAPPPVADRDNDGVPDSADACPDTPGVKTDDPQTNGCKDTDGDAIFDPKDACPTERGAPNPDPSLNGCPDADGDGILDKVDACPKEPGVANPDPKKNGCPADKDRDKDGIPNDADACPDEPGPADPDPKRNGCPKAFISQGQIKILDQVKFKVGSAAIEPGKESLEILEAVEKVLRDHPEVKKVRVEGHTDKTGSAALNKKLSADRAAAVVKWLTGKGIAAGRLSSAGFGPERPIDTNDTEQGKKNNRRVEFHIE